MIAEKIEGCVTELRAFAGQVSEEQWARIKCVIAELTDAAAMVATVGAVLIIPSAVGFDKAETQQEIVEIVHKMWESITEKVEAANG